MTRSLAPSPTIVAPLSTRKLILKRLKASNLWVQVQGERLAPSPLGRTGTRHHPHNLHYGADSSGSTREVTNSAMSKGTNRPTITPTRIIRPFLGRYGLSLSAGTALSMT